MNEIFTRVSIRRFEDRAVEKEKIEQILRAAMAAPSAGNQQPWEFYVVTDAEKCAELAKAHQYAGPAAKAPVVLVPCVKREGAMFPEMAETDLAIASENILLEITSLGLGGVFLAISPVEQRIANVRKALDISDDLTPFALIALGYAAESRKQEDRYDESRVHWCE